MAQILKAFGGPENFAAAEILKAGVRPGMVLVRLRATSVNAIDIKIRTGLPIGPDLPAVLGADVDGVTAGRGFDVVFDTVGGDNLQTSFSAAACRGQVAITNGRTTQDLGLLHAKALSFHPVFMLLPMLRGRGRERHERTARSVAKMVEAGKLRSLIDDRRFTLDTAPDAHRRLESGKAVGKVVIDIK